MHTARLAYLALALTSACATLVSGPIHLRVAAYTGGVASSIPPAATIALLENPKAENPLLERELHSKLRRLLEGRGYRVVPFDDAAYAVMAFYGIGAHTEITTASVLVPGTTTTIYGQSGAPVGSLQGQSSLQSVPTTETVNDRWLTLIAVDVVQGRKENKVIQAWRGEGRSSGSSSDLRYILDYMLIPMIDVFGNNQSQKSTTLLQEDRRVKALRAP